MKSQGRGRKRRYQKRRVAVLTVLFLVKGTGKVLGTSAGLGERKSVIVLVTAVVTVVATPWFK